MDHLDLEGMLSSTSATWMLPTFDQQDATFLSSSRQILEPIIEETSEDEENQNWSQFESAWSSESDTGSVIRIELHNDQDSISERDFACPPKRPRRSDELLIYEDGLQQQQQNQQQSQTQPVRKYHRNENLVNNNTINNDTSDNNNFRKRFDELYSDSDSLSYNSLSRSSSLIQFESLERQFQNDLSSLGNSSPSLLSFTDNDDLNKGSDSNLRRYESSDGRLHQAFFDLDKIDFTNTLIFSDNDQNHNYHMKSDSESSDNSILSHEERILKASKNHLNSTNDQRSSSSYKGGKSSAENLSEDSGYGEYITGLRIKSKSIPNFLRTYDKFCEEDEFENHKSLEMIYTQENTNTNSNIVNNAKHHIPLRLKNENRENMNFPNELLTKIDSTNKRMSRRSSSPMSSLVGNQQQQHKISSTSSSSRTSSCIESNNKSQRCFYNNIEDADSVNNSDCSGGVANDHDNDKHGIYNNDANAYNDAEEDNDHTKYYQDKVKNKIHMMLPLPSSSYISSSLPDVRIQYNHEFDANNFSELQQSYDYHYHYGDRRQHNKNNLYRHQEQYTTVSSVPDNLNLISLSGNNKKNDNVDNILYRTKSNDDHVLVVDSRNYDENDDDIVWSLRSPTFVRSENRLTDKYFGFSTNSCSSVRSSQKIQHNYMNASYNNLTLLDYSGKSHSFTMSDYSGGNSKRNSRELDLGKGNYLLDELSEHFDRNLSIISDRERDSDLVSDYINNDKYNHNDNEQKPIKEQEQQQEEMQQQQQQQQPINKRSKVPPKPPIRRSSMKKEATVTTQSDLELEIQAIEPKISKTFDLDPTNLKTSYAESLEKCNFDPKELSATDLTAILVSNHHHRSNSTAFKRGFVASTPNLNTFRGSRNELDELRDDLQVSSAHNSMNPIPGEKKLGILLTSGSRNSLGKGVSFCPIVSEISWREQSSDEFMEPDSLENVYNDHLASSEDDAEYDDDDDDEDEDDGGFREHQKQKQQQQQQQQKLITVVTITTTPTQPTNYLNNSQLKGNNNTNNQKIQVNAEINNSNTKNSNNSATSVASCEYQQQKHKENLNSHSQHNENQQQQQILPLPSVSVKVKSNRNISNATIAQQFGGCDIGLVDNVNLLHNNSAATNINRKNSNKINVDASKIIQKQSNEIMLDKNITVISDNSIVDDRKPVLKTIKNVNVNRDVSGNKILKNNSENIIMETTITSMSKTPIDSSCNTKTTKTSQNTGTDLLSTKFKPKPDEKHHKNGFLSRFTGGFRFSLRRKKKTNNDNDKNSNDGSFINKQYNNNKKSVADGAVKSQSLKNSKTPDYVYIPLKEPKSSGTISKNQQKLLSIETSSSISPYNNRDDDNERHLSEIQVTSSSNDNNSHVLLGKPPLPKQPPRVVGVCEKIRACQNLSYINGTVGGGGAAAAGATNLNNIYNNHALNQRHTIHKTREIDERFLDSERDYYRNQLDGTMNGNGCGNNNNNSILPPPPSFAGPDNTSVCTTQQQYQQQIGNNITITTVNINGKNCNIIGAQNGKNKIGLIETDLDTHETVITGKTRSLMELGPQVRLQLHKQDAGGTCQHDSNIVDSTSRRPHKSMEFLLDKENQKNILPPENELQKTHDSTAALSEHQLRVQASLQRLNIPDWFRQYSSTPKSTTDTGYKTGAFTRKRTSDSGRWTGLNSKTTSLSSLGSQRSDRSPLMLSPSAHSHHGGQTGFSRWSTSHLNSTQTSPSISTRGSFSRGGIANSSFISGHSVGGSSIRNSFRQPYLGWRSQEKLAQPRTPHERLASSLLSQQPQKPEPAVTPEIQSSIKEVTSAIVHYVNDQTNRTSRSRSASPTSRKCWLESSFVGIRPLDSPQTPVIDNSFNTTANSSTRSGITTDGGLRMNGVGESTII